MDGILLFSARNDHDLYDCASKRRTGEFSLICGYFLFVDRKIGYRLKDLRMKFVVNKNQRNEKGSRNVTGAACGTSLY